MSSGFIFLLTDGKTEAWVGKIVSPVSPAQLSPYFLHHPHQGPLSLHITSWCSIPHPLLMRPQGTGWSRVRSLLPATPQYGDTCCRGFGIRGNPGGTWSLTQPPLAASSARSQSPGLTPTGLQCTDGETDLGKESGWPLATQQSRSNDGGESSEEP